MSGFGDTYGETQRAISDVLEARDLARGRGERFGDNGKWPAWAQLCLSVLVIIVSVVLAYSALNTRITVVESKLDDLRQQIGNLRQ